jgi:transmembrane sensor
MSEVIFRKILDNTATDSEKSGFYESLEADNDQREVFQQYKNINSISNFKAAKYADIQRRSFDGFWKRVKPISKSRRIQMSVRYAAVFMIALSVGYFMRYLVPLKKEVQVMSEHIVYTSEKGSVSTIHLEDGSAIWLSSGSKITLDRSSTGEMSALLNGEAYFDLIPSNVRKFTVDLGYFKVKDIGTKFNVRAYSFEPNVFATLVDGKIDLFKGGDNSILSMNPGEYLKYDKQTSKMAVTQQDPSISTAWREGKFVFIDKTLGEICKELENWYNVEIIIKNKALANNKYTSVIKRTTTVKMVLKMISLTDKINYKIDERKEVRDIVYIY